MVTKIVFGVIASALFFVLYYSVTLYLTIQVSKKLVTEAVPYEHITDNHSVTLLVLGDSTAVGVGALSGEDTVAGRLAKYVHATYVENKAVSGAIVIDLPSQVKRASLVKYSYVLVQIGANDIIRFHGAEESARQLEVVLKNIPKTDNLIVLTAGNVGGTPFFPWFMRPFYTKRTLEYHDLFAKVVAHAKGTYVNLYVDPASDPVILDPSAYLAEDNLHLSSLGYKIWFEAIAKKLEAHKIP